VSWNHRGTGGSDRPRDRSRVAIEQFVEDALSVMDHYGVDRSVLMGWSMGVNTMFELTVRHPERVTGLFAVAGVPGDTFSTMLGPLQLPRLAAKTLTVNLARVLKLGGKALTPVARRLPVGPRGISFLSHTGFMFHIPDPELAAVAIKEFLTTPVDWYMHLGVHTARHPRVSLRDIKVPVVLVAATYDILAGARHMATAAERLADATYVELHGTHFIQMEQPERVHQLLRDFLHRVG
jgi:pimeloyl-ACP methyl ester carboxylesterase